MGLNRSSRPHRSGPIDHDVFEGLPVRRWARQSLTFSQVPKPPVVETAIVDPQSLPELPMPRDANLLTPLSRALLRAARAGCTYIRPVRKDPEAEEVEQKDDEELAAEQAENERKFTATKWTVASRGAELPDVEFLAPRRMGLPSLYRAGVQVNIPADSSSKPMRKTKFKKTDPNTGEISIYEAWVPDGYQVEGEIVQEADVIAANPDVRVVNVEPAPGTVVAGVGVVSSGGVVVATSAASAVVPIGNKSKRKLKSGSKSKSRKRVMFAPGNGTEYLVAPGTDLSVAQSAVPQNGATPETGRGPGDDEDDEDEDEEGDGSEGEDGATADPEPKPTDRGATDEVIRPETDITTKTPPQYPKADQISTAPSRSPPTAADIPLTPTIPSEGIKEDTIATQGSNEAAIPSESQQTEPAHLSNPSPPAQTTENATQNSSAVPATEASSLDTNLQATNEENRSVGDEFVRPQLPAKEEDSLPDIQPSTGAQVKSQSPPLSASKAGPDMLPAAGPTIENLIEKPITADNNSLPPKPAFFEDGEVDLLGSLEASLDIKGDSIPDSTARSQLEEAPGSTTVHKESDNRSTEMPTAQDKEKDNREKSDDVKDVEMTG